MSSKESHTKSLEVNKKSKIEAKCVITPMLLKNATLPDTYEIVIYEVVIMAFLTVLSKAFDCHLYLFIAKLHLIFPG